MTLAQLAFEAVLQEEHLMLSILHTPKQFIIEIQIREIINNYVKNYERINHNDFFKFLANLHKSYYGKIPLRNHGIILVQMCRYFDKFIKYDMEDIVLGMKQLTEYIYETLTYCRGRIPLADVFLTPDLEIVVSINKGELTYFIKINSLGIEYF